MDKLNMHTPNLADENYKKLAALFPNAVTETIDPETGEVVRAIDKDILMQEINARVVEGREERYQFTWPDKRKAVLAANAPIAATLRPVKADSVGKDGTPGGWDSENLYIEGDNLDVLKLLRETYLGKVKMIYIDPPYNTGNDFVYEDDFAEDADSYIAHSGQYDEQGNRLVQNTESKGRFHTNWLNMIYPRLRVAKDLMAEDGVIFISLDDSEIINMRRVCDEVFASCNFVGQITVVGNPRGRDYGGVARMHDYLLVYKKSENATLNLIRDAENQFKMEDDLGGFELRELRNRNVKFNKENRPNLYYPFYINPNNSDKYDLHPISLEKKEGWIELWPLPSQGINVVWRWGREKAASNLNVNICAKPMRDGRYMIVEKYRESRMMARSVWWDKDTNTEKGTLLVKDLMEGKVFDYPKPVEMIERMLEMGTLADDDAIVMDFFSGSATTAHAVMQLNAEDGGRRKFIMVQIPEVCDEKSEAYKAGYKNICEIGKERIRRAGRKIKEEAGLTAQDLDIGFRVLRLDSSNMQDVYYMPSAMAQNLLDTTTDNIKPDRTPEDLLFQVMLELGVLPSSKIVETVVDGKRVFDVADGFLLACFDDGVTSETVTAIAKSKPYYAVFRDASMADDSTATNFDQIFETYSPSTVRKVL